jgi:hypothetical protein
MDRLTQRRDDIGADDLPRDAGRLGSGRELGMTVRRGGVGEYLAENAVDTERLAYGLWTFGDELALRTPERPLTKTSDPAYPARPNGQLRRRSQPTDSLLALTSSGRFCFASSTSASNAAGSLTASSARCLRSTSTSAAFKPWMKRLYVMSC